MPQYTFPNQRTIIIHKESLNKDFLGISNPIWQAAARDLGAHAFLLYVYLAANKDNYNLALSQVAVTNATGMPRSTYHDQFKKLVLKGYLVYTNGNTYEFFEKPRTSDVTQPTDDTLSHGQQLTATDKDSPAVAQKNLQEDIQINNINTFTNNGINKSARFPNENKPIEKARFMF